MGYFRETVRVEIIDFLLLGELISNHTSPLVSHTAGKLVPSTIDPIVVTALPMGFPVECLGPATCGYACNCPVPEGLTTEASGQLILLLIT